MPRTKPVPGHEVQKHIYGNNCFGCGPANESGLHLEFHLDEQHKRFVDEIGFVILHRARRFSASTGSSLEAAGRHRGASEAN